MIVRSVRAAKMSVSKSAFRLSSIFKQGNKLFHIRGSSIFYFLKFKVVNVSIS